VTSAFQNVLPLRSDLSRTGELICKIEELILEKGIRPGVRLGSKEELCKCFSVSPGTLNEALRVLEMRGIVELRRGSKGGVFAAAGFMQCCLDQVPFGARLDDSVALEQCLVVIGQLEPLVAIEAAKSAKREAVAELYCLVGQMAPADPHWLKRCCLFQQRLAQMGSNAVLTCVYTTLLSYLEQQRASFAPMPDRSSRQSAIIAHRALVDAVASGDAQQAAAAASLAREWLVPRSALRKEGLKPSVWTDGLCENDTHVLVH
jgi:DNA-binding FadR family transcriptional regulator